MRDGVMYRHPFDEEGWIVLQADVVRTLETYRQAKHSDLEAGGILLGFRRGRHLHIVEATTPQKTDIRSRFSFNRAKRGHANRAIQAWKMSGGYVDYLGEWHTHAETVPTPSGIDTREWDKLLCKHRVPLIFLIVGIQTNWIGVGTQSAIRGFNPEPQQVDA